MNSFQFFQLSFFFFFLVIKKFDLFTNNFLIIQTGSQMKKPNTFKYYFINEIFYKSIFDAESNKEKMKYEMKILIVKKSS